ncbi:MAG: HD domain-containing protein [Chloroflexi bacterium]|nr:HD domain-containing protein [Chloroflexota bacterium]
MDDARVTVRDLERDPEVVAYLRSANAMMNALGFTEHGERHANLVAKIAFNILTRLGYTQREAELAAIAGFMHDTGNLIHRDNHTLSGALLTREILIRLKMPFDEIALVMGAVGNHEEPIGVAVNKIAAAVIIADKADVHSSRVQNADPKSFDIHDRVNFAVRRSFVNVDSDAKMITLDLEIDPTLSTVSEYFEIFLSRMLMCRRAAQFLDCQFALVINGHRLM